jgi:nucleotide-binding universal stress UspA family protein
MRDIHPTPSIVVGIDGSKAAMYAAVRAVDEAVKRDIPLRLLYVIDPKDLCGADADRIQFASARAALYEAQLAVEATKEPVKVETEVVLGKPLAKLAEESRWAVKVYVGSIGAEHARHGVSSVAAGLPALASSPVAVIRSRTHPPAIPEAGRIVVEADDGVVMRHGFDEARLREVPLQIVATWQAEVPDDLADRKRQVQVRLNRRIAQWTRLYPDVQVEAIAIHDDICRYLAANAESVQLFVTGAAERCSLNRQSDITWSVLTVRQSHL